MPIALSAILGFCGVIYEFVFAQTLSVLFGNSVVQYGLTIGLFLCFMGLGAHLSERFQSPRVILGRCQVWISVMAPLAVIGVWLAAAFNQMLMARLLAYSAMITIGILTGMELPFLMKLKSRASAAMILSADYAGMLMACFLFPLLLLPYFGVLTTLFSTAFLNSLVRLSLGRAGPAHYLLPLLLMTGIFLEPGLREWLSYRLTL